MTSMKKLKDPKEATMKLTGKDNTFISSVYPPIYMKVTKGETFEVPVEIGEKLLKEKPDIFKKASDETEEVKVSKIKGGEINGIFRI